MQFLGKVAMRVRRAGNSRNSSATHADSAKGARKRTEFTPDALMLVDADTSVIAAPDGCGRADLGARGALAMMAGQRSVDVTLHERQSRLSLPPGIRVAIAAGLTAFVTSRAATGIRSNVAVHFSPLCSLITKSWMLEIAGLLVANPDNEALAVALDNAKDVKAACLGASGPTLAIDAAITLNHDGP